MDVLGLNEDIIAMIGIAAGSPTKIGQNCFLIHAEVSDYPLSQPGPSIAPSGDVPQLVESLPPSYNALESINLKADSRQI